MVYWVQHDLLARNYGTSRMKNITLWKYFVRRLFSFRIYEAPQSY